MRRRSAVLSPHLPGRAAQPDVPDSSRAPWRRQGGGGASLDTFRVSSLSLRLSPVGPGCEVEGRWRNGRGGEEGVVRKIAATRSPPQPAPRGAPSPTPRPEAPAPCARPCPAAAPASPARTGKGPLLEGLWGSLFQKPEGGARSAFTSSPSSSLASLSSPPAPRGHPRTPPWQRATPRP